MMTFDSTTQTIYLSGQTDNKSSQTLHSIITSIWKYLCIDWSMSLEILLLTH